MAEPVFLRFSVKDLGSKTIAKITTGVKKLGVGLTAIVSKRARFVRAMGAMTRGVTGFVRTLTSMKTLLIGGVGFLIFNRIFNKTLSLVKSGVRSFAELEVSIVDLAKVTDLGLMGLRRTLTDLPAIFGTTAELAKGLYQIISAGVTGPIRSIKTLTESLKLAKFAHVDIADVVKGSTKVMAIFSDELKNAEDVNDFFLAIEKAGQTSIREFIPSIGGLAAISKELSISTSELGAGLATITQVAGNTEEAAVQYRAALINLLNPSDALKVAYDNIGVAGFQAAVKQFGFIEALRKVKDQAGGSTAALVKLVPNVRALLGILALGQNDFENMNDKMKIMEDRVGSSADAWEKWKATLAGTFEETSSNWSKFLDVLGEAAAPALQQGLSDINEWFEKIRTSGRLDVFMTEVSVGFLKALELMGQGILKVTELFLKFKKVSAKFGAIGEGLNLAGLFRKRDDLRKALEEIKDPGLLRKGLDAVSGIFVDIPMKAARIEIIEFQLKKLNNEIAASTTLLGGWEKTISDTNTEQFLLGKSAESLRDKIAALNLVTRQGATERERARLKDIEDARILLRLRGAVFGPSGEPGVGGTGGIPSEAELNALLNAGDKDKPTIDNIIAFRKKAEEQVSFFSELVESKLFEFSQNSSAFLSESFFDVMIGKTRSWQEAIASFGRSALRVFTDLIAQALVFQAISGISGLFSPAAALGGGGGGGGALAVPPVNPFSKAAPGGETKTIILEKGSGPVAAFLNPDDLDDYLRSRRGRDTIREVAA